ncbi:cysteine hydrolase [Niabella sp. CC-SYL272]|uniref:cysteine hydrolase family protein n=1 Tax=Niabella agricola TaxID=2891571 RepID=UPI001F48EDBA|nr:isochorismatase family cysteine hydrolase [Niabella agricola]MCF3107202.1 cysteine hydrolase [Niabella agricola]
MLKDRIIIIDAQKDFTEPGFAYGQHHPLLKNIWTVVQKLNILLEQTQPGRVILVDSSYLPNQFGPGFSACVRGTEGHQSSLGNIEVFRRFEKTNHSCFSSKDFSAHLQATQIDRLMLCGFLTEYCVKATALDALSRGFRVTVCPDLLGSADDKQLIKEQALAEMEQRGATIQCPGY